MLLKGPAKKKAVVIDFGAVERICQNIGLDSLDLDKFRNFLCSQIGSSRILIAQPVVVVGEEENKRFGDALDCACFEVVRSEQLGGSDKALCSLLLSLRPEEVGELLVVADGDGEYVAALEALAQAGVRVWILATKEKQPADVRQPLSEGLERLCRSKAVTFVELFGCQALFARTNGKHPKTPELIHTLAMEWSGNLMQDHRFVQDLRELVATHRTAGMRVEVIGGDFKDL